MMLALSWRIQASHEMPQPIHPLSFEALYTATLSGVFCTTKPGPSYFAMLPDWIKSSLGVGGIFHLVEVGVNGI